MEKILEFLSENFQFLVVKFSIYLNRRVFVMSSQIFNAARHQRHMEAAPDKSGLVLL